MCKSMLSIKATYDVPVTMNPDLTEKNFLINFK